jgi:hypothetical protein
MILGHLTQAGVQDLVVDTIARSHGLAHRDLARGLEGGRRDHHPAPPEVGELPCQEREQKHTWQYDHELGVSLSSFLAFSFLTLGTHSKHIPSSLRERVDATLLALVDVADQLDRGNDDASDSKHSGQNDHVLSVALRLGLAISILKQPF